MTAVERASRREAGALAGVRVLELGGGIAGPFAARLLGDLGADVVKLEFLPDGDVTRTDGPAMAPGRPSALFEYLNWNKRGVALDPVLTPAGRLAALVRGADVVIVGLSRRQACRAGVEASVLRRIDERAVIVTVSPFGHSGPYADLEAGDLVIQAASGMMAISGTRERGPLKHGLRTSLYCAGLNAAYAALAGHLAATRSRQGVWIDVSAQETMASELVMNHAYLSFTGIVQGRPAAAGDPLDGHPLPAANGHLSLQTSARQTMSELAQLLGEPALSGPRYATTADRVARSAELRMLLTRSVGARPARELFRDASRGGFLSGAVQGAGELLSCRQLAQRDVYVEFEERCADGDRWRLPARLVSLSATPTSVRRRAPGLGEHNDETPPWGRRAPRPAAGDAASRPLSGLRVIDLSVIFAAPYMGALLADLGAEVMKVEAPHRLDQTRTDWGGYLDDDPGQDPWNRSGTFQEVNRGKRSVAIDLADERGRELLRGLVARSDVLIENFTPRVMRGWGTTYEQLRELNPGLVMLSNTGYGSTGEWSTFKAQGTTLEATMGLMAVTGYRDGEPARAGQSAPDFLACWTGLLAILAALIHRRATGEGQWIDLGMYQLGPAVIPEALIERQATGADRERAGSEELGAAVSGVARTLDGWLAVSVQDETGLRALAGLLGEGGGERWTAIERWALERETGAAAAELRAVGVGAAPVLDAAGLERDPHLAQRGFYEPVAIESLGVRKRLIGRPYRWTSEATEVAIAGPAPAFAEGNEYVLRDVLGLPAEQIDALYAAGVVVAAPLAGARSPRPLVAEEAR